MPSSKEHIITIICLLLALCSVSTATQDDQSADLVERLLTVLTEQRDGLKESPLKEPAVSEEQQLDEVGELLELSQTEDEKQYIDRRSSQVGACRGGILTLTALKGTISTPYYGTHRYPNSARCRWRIVSQDHNGKIQIKFKTPFSIEKGRKCAYDSLSIYNGTRNDASPIGRYCNSNPPPVTILRKTNAVFLLFVSDLSIAGAGFTLDYTIIPAPIEEQQACTGKKLQNLRGYNGTITSQNYPKAYGGNLLCRWLIKVHAGELVRLDFNDFDIEADIGGCTYDNLTVYDGESKRSMRIGQYCGTQVPADITTSGNSAFIVFATDDSVAQKGFKISYHAVQGTTAAPGTSVGKSTPSPRPRVDLSCSFEEGNMCLWTQGAGGAVDWKLRSAKRNTYRISDGVLWGGKDHTLGNSTGHYIVIDGNERVQVAYSKGFLISPLLSRGPADGRCLTLWYNMYFTKGVLQVLMRREGEDDEVIWERAGSQGNGWHKGRISLTSGEPYRLVLVGSRGSVDTETGIAVDDIRVEDSPCLAVQLDCGKRSPSFSSSSSKREFLEQILSANQPPEAMEKISERILGGQPSSVGMWPWIVNIRTKQPGGKSYMACGGSLIDRQWVLTAAHCFESEGKWMTDPINIELRLGEANVGANAWEQSQINIRPAKVIIHPQRSSKAMGQVAPHDMALVKLPHRVMLTSEINVVCLPSAGAIFRPGAACVVSGWGLTANGKGGSESLLHIDLNILSNRMCTRYFGSTIGTDLVCAKHNRQMKAACKGDSGGPLVCRAGDHYVLAGVVSWGVPCTRHNRPLPSAFAKVTYYLPWIQSTINSEQ